MVFSIYFTVIAWVYAIGRIIVLVQDQNRRKTIGQVVLRLRKALSYVIDGIEIPDGLIWRWMFERRSRRAHKKTAA